MNSVRTAMIAAAGFAIIAATSGTASAQIVALGASNTQGKGVGAYRQYGGNDKRRGISPAQHQANVAQIEGQLSARNIRVVHADGYIRQAIQAGLTQSDKIHLTVEGHRQVAEQLLSSVR